MSQSEPSDNGNNGTLSRVVNQQYKYDFVINNYTELEVSQVSQSISEICKKAVFGLEVGESGTPHIQGYISLKKKMRITELAKIAGFARASFRKVRNENALIEYCQKENCCFKLGFKKTVRIVETLRPWQLKVETSCKQTPDERTINWIYDPDTNNGKTTFTKYMVVKHKAMFFTGGKKADIACQLALEEKGGRDLNDNMIVLFNFGFEEDEIDYKVFENLKDGLISSSKYKSSGLCFNNPHIWIMSNQLPNERIISNRINVWKIWKIEENDLVEIGF